MQILFFHTAALMIMTARLYRCISLILQTEGSRAILICDVYLRVAETCSVAQQIMAQRRSARTPDHEEHLPQDVGDYLGISENQVVLSCRTLHSTTWRALCAAPVYVSYLMRAVSFTF